MKTIMAIALSLCLIGLTACSRDSGEPRPTPGSRLRPGGDVVIDMQTGEMK